ncbi:MAG: valine--tRNA ligase [Gammaproteobacteria bacterium]|nr:valine--tRNA ligase [Gammaproteobacteria bacterium]
MEKNYSPEQIEPKWAELWEHQYKFGPKGNGEPFCVMLPPPNVTGTLHMGHGFQHTLIDITTRYQRMNGKQTLWQPGTDHAGIATQLIVETQLEQQGIHKKDLSREAFLDHVWKWKEQSGGTITKQMRRLGTSVDWTRERFTLDEGLSAAVQRVFIELFEEGLIYRGNRLVNWDPKLGTAVSDLEVLSQEEDGFMWHIRYPIVGQKDYLTVATTRPETLLGDSAVAVHPDDTRYQHLIGQELELPFCDRRIPVIADSQVDMEFGSGCVKITPAHDFNDYEMGKRHQLPMINILTKNANINKHAPVKYQGMDRFKAREQIIKDLESQGLVEKIVPHKLFVPRGEKSNTIIEPLLTDQWYVKTGPLAKPAIEAVKNGRIEFVPENWSKTYFHWMENIQDWCISRQLWWGHRIPAWYDTLGHIYVGINEEDVRLKYKLDAHVILKQDEDVLDTWFSSALWSFSTLGWPEQTQELKTFYPTSVLFTGFDIIFFWVARMIMFGLKFAGNIPFKKIVITGLVCDHEGKKMSKSKGNVLDPLDIINGISLEALLEKRTNHLMINSNKQLIAKATEKQFPMGITAFGADALRFTFCALASQSRTIKFDMSRVEGYHFFCNKLWNATRFVMQNTESHIQDLEDGAFQYGLSERWILAKLQDVIQQARQHTEHYRFDLLAQVLFDFVWHHYCDWYLELAKTTLYDEAGLAASKRGTRKTLVHILDQILKLLHPIMPFITEEIWHKVSKLNGDIFAADCLMWSKYPEIKSEYIDTQAMQEMEWLQNIIQSIRTIRSEMGVNPGKKIPLLIKVPAQHSFSEIQQYQPILMNMAKLLSIQSIPKQQTVGMSASAVVDGWELFIPMSGLIDKDAELARLDKEMKKIQTDIDLAEKKLSLAAFVDKAPADVVIKEQDKLKEAQALLQKRIEHRQMIESL